VRAAVAHGQIRSMRNKTGAESVGEQVRRLAVLPRCAAHCGCG